MPTKTKRLILRNPRTVCRQLKKRLGVELNIHHLRFPASLYKSDPLARTYRDLPCQSVIISTDEHASIHANQDNFPEMPDRQVMQETIDSCAKSGCNDYHCSRPVQFVTTGVNLIGHKLPACVVAVDVSVVS